MREQIRQYIIFLYQYIPQEIYVGLFSVFCLGTAAFITILGWKRGRRKVAGLALVEYVFLLYCSTVIFRTCSETHAYNLTPFWSYNRSDLLLENIMNVIAFVPVGYLFGSTFRRIKWWLVMLIGLCMSISIEFLQYLLQKGFSELDDVIHNSLGCLIGAFMFYSLSSKFIKNNKI